ncbi:MAG: biotin carboxylase N-terminal domain-containing protein [Ramlibacter sp.]
MFRKILIANRGEIACRIARTVRRMGLQVATVHSQADANALHVREVGESVLVGEAPARSSYLDVAAVLQAAHRVGADAIHPGFGFLSENAAFAAACAQAGITFIGPRPEVLALFGDKAAAKKLARQLDIPTAGGLAEPSEDVDALLAALRDLPLPCVLKAAAGGGGKGMRVVHDAADARAALEAAIREGRSAFGDGRLIAERYLAGPRHVEVQILGDGAGGVLHLHDRECTLQRRFQKVVEEAPVTSLPGHLRDQLAAHAIALGRATRYLGLGTVEFAVTGHDAVFLEVNPRLQVEHPVTEAVTGLDLVQLQVETVATGRLPFEQADLPAPRGVAVQARLYAEDPAQGFLPSTGRVALFEAPAGIRTDAGVANGDSITPHYDPMVAKLIAHGSDRPAALQRLRAALAQTTLLGVASNRGLLLDLLADGEVQRNAVTTEFIDDWLARRGAPAVAARRIAALGALWLRRQRGDDRASLAAWGDPALAGWRLRRGGPADLPPHTHTLATAHGTWSVGFGAMHEGALAVRVENEVLHVDTGSEGAGVVTVDGQAVRLRVHAGERQVHAAFADGDLVLDLQPLHAARAGGAAAAHGVVRAPMMGVMILVDVQPGQAVQAGDRLGSMESMKMEMALTAPVAGRVASIGCAPQDKVERHQELFRIEA